VEQEEDPEAEDERLRKHLLKIFSNSFVSYPEILSMTQLVDLLGGTVEFRLRLARRSEGTTPRDSKERKDV